MFHVEGLELFGQISYLKSGLFYSDASTAVSPTYAQEITTPEFAYGLQGLLSGLKAQDRLVGIFKRRGRKYLASNVDQYIPHHYKLKYMAGKKKNKS